MGNSKDQGLRQVEELVRKNMDTTQYDPEQPEEERRQLRIRYRDLQEQTFEKRRELVVQDNGDGLLKILSQSNTLFSEVKNTQEAILDSRFLVLASDLNTQKTQNINIGQDTEVNLDEFVAKVITSSSEGVNHVHDVCLDWKLIGQRAIKFGKRAYTMDFMLGPLSVQRKESKRARTGKLSKNKEDLVMPAQLKEGDIQKQENETSNNVNNIYNTLKEVGPINYFKFVTNPESFSQTVENIFYVSFLARKGVAGISTTSGQPILETKKPQDDSNVEDMVNKKQIIMGIDIKDWKDIINTYQITTSCIPTRLVKENSASSSGWY